MPVIVIDVEKSKAPSKVQHSEDRTWTPYPLGRVVAPVIIDLPPIESVPQYYPEYPPLKGARLVPRAQSWEGLPNSKGMRW